MKKPLVGDWMTPDPITITLEKTAKIFNDKGPKIVIDGGGSRTRGPGPLC